MKVHILFGVEANGKSVCLYSGQDISAFREAAAKASTEKKGNVYRFVSFFRAKNSQLTKLSISRPVSGVAIPEGISKNDSE